MNTKYFKNLCTMSQEKLKTTVTAKLKKKYEDVTVADGFVFAKGEVPILLVAHMDTVHKELPKSFEYKDGKLSSPQGIGGDDRCGVYAILEITNKHKCSVLFCEDEEVGGIGAREFIKHDVANDLTFNYIIELDRMHKDDAVFYNCDNDDFEDFITKDGTFKTSWGSFSDISIIAPALGVAAVNISCGYYNAHQKTEYVVLNELDYCIKNVCKLIERTTETDKFEYIEAKHYYNGRYYGGYYGGSYYGSYGYSDYGNSYYSRGSQYSMFDDDDYERKGHYYEVYFKDEKGFDDSYGCTADSKYEALGKFMKKNPTRCFKDVSDIVDFGEDAYNI